jgi:ATP-dependent Lon protease
MQGGGSLTLTGQLGDVMKESARTALSWFRANATRYGVDPAFYKDAEIHMHVPSGAIPKDGPSAGITMATTLVSALTKIPTRRDVAMTGEITLRGKVLPIGGVKEKVLAAHRAGVTNIVLPRDNEKDLADIPKNVLDSLDIHMVSTMDEVLKIALAEPLPARIPAAPVVAEVTEPAGDTRPH